MKINVQIQGIDGIKRKLAEIPDQLADRALSAALNKTGDKAKAEMVRAITDEYNIKRSDVAPRMNLKRATRNDLYVVLDPFASGSKISRSKGRALNLIHFLDHRATKKAERMAKRVVKRGTQRIGGRVMPVLYFKIKKGEPPKPIPGAFIGNHGRTVFIRTSKDRLPIEGLSTIGVPQMFSARKINARVMARINEALPIEVDRAIKMVMERFGK